MDNSEIGTAAVLIAVLVAFGRWAGPRVDLLLKAAIRRRRDDDESTEDDG